MATDNLTAAMLRDLLIYNQETGVFAWKPKAGNNAVVGAEAGWSHANGYRRIRLCGKLLLAHRLAWLWVHGEWPRGHIDHINGDPSDNRIANLRDVNYETNQQNQRRARSDNKLGVLGVRRMGKKFLAQIKVDRRQTYLGLFDTAEAAHAAYLEAKRKYHAGCTI